MLQDNFEMAFRRLQNEFSRVVFGVNLTPFLAQFVTQHYAQIHRTEYRLAAEAALKSTYKDDSMDSVPNDDQGIQLYKQLSQLCHGAGMHARKWFQNSPVVLNEIPPEDRASDTDFNEGFLPSVTTLGVLWQATEDAFTFKARPPNWITFPSQNGTSSQRWPLFFTPLGS